MNIPAATQLNQFQDQFQLAKQFSLASSAQSLADKGNAVDVNDEAALEAVAKEFESLFMNMVMKSSRSASRTFSEDNYFNTFETKMYEDMLDEKMSVSLSQTRSLGIADLLVQQLGGNRVNVRYDLPMGIPTRQQAFDDAEDFVSTLIPKARLAAEALGVDAKLVVAQAALESGWGEHMMFTASGENSFNLFGIKANADWQGARISIESLEVSQGVTQKERSDFKVYDNYEAAISDYAGLLKNNPRYKDVLNNGGDIGAFGQGLLQGGYATDPAYAKKLEAIMQNPVFTKIQYAGGLN